MSVRWLEADWPAPPGIRTLSTYRAGGVSGGNYASLNLGDHVGDDPESVAENRARLRRAANLPAEPLWLAQVHGVQVADLDASDPRSPADAAFTRSPNRICAVLTADCLPVLFATRDGDVVGAAHAGWRGLAAGVIEATLEFMGVEPDRTLVWLGPAIGPQAFEVGGEVREAFLRQDEGSEGAFRPNSRGRYLADLASLVRRRLELAGVTHIHGGGECTYSAPDRYFSHRRDGQSGRQATLIWRTEPR
jgi:purine-nucleoside/S-methyl-5'-thioadenosine phosphorylase / adenosine deaminase